VTAVRQLIWDGLSIAEQRNSSDSVVKQFFSQGQINSGTPLFYTRDHLGSIREVANASGDLVTRYNYDPYGRRTVVTGPDDVDFGFTGHFYHAQSGLHLAPYRAYSADLGRWLSRDPYQEIDGPNVYAYAKNGPSTYIDPLGATTDALGLLSGTLQLTFPFIPASALISGKIVGNAIVALEIDPIFAALYQRLRAFAKSRGCYSGNGPLSSGPGPDSRLPLAPSDPDLLPDLLKDIAKDLANEGLAYLFEGDPIGGWAAFGLNLTWASEPFTQAVSGVYSDY
jgi:RHS repeat-associated protein